MSGAASAVDEYWEYTRIVGKDDGGKVMSPKEYEAYKAKMLPQREANRLFTSWTNPDGMDCILVGPQTMCFCLHRYISHRTDYQTLPATRPIPTPCREKGCKCAAFEYLPWSGGGPIRCSCKHSGGDHSKDPKHLCEKCNCSGFNSSYTCNCTQPYSAHKMIVEGRSEREKRGKPVGRETGFQAMGGITGFSSLIHGYQRLDASGVGEADPHLLARADDSTFVRALAPKPQQRKALTKRRSSPARNN